MWLKSNVSDLDVTVDRLYRVIEDKETYKVISSDSFNEVEIEMHEITNGNFVILKDEDIQSDLDVVLLHVYQDCERIVEKYNFKPLHYLAKLTNSNLVAEIHRIIDDLNLKNKEKLKLLKLEFKDNKLVAILEGDSFVAQDGYTYRKIIKINNAQI